MPHLRIVDSMTEHQPNDMGCIAVSARIGEATSTLDDGIVSHVSVLAQELGVQPGHLCRAMVDTLME